MDAFADLAWNSPSNANNPKNVTLGAQQKAQTPSISSASSSMDSFGRLAAAQPTAIAQPRPISSASSTNPITMARQPPRTGSNGSSSNDPFSNLFARGGSPNINMSMADRRAHAEREKRERERREKEKLNVEGAMWDQFEGHLSAQGSNVGSRTTSPSPAIFNAATNASMSSRATPPIGLKTNPGVKTVASPPSGNGDLFWSMHHSPQSNPARATSPLRGSSPGIRQPTPMIDTLLSSNASKSSPSQLSNSNNAWDQLDALVSPKPSSAAAAPSASRLSAGLDPFDIDALMDAPVTQPTQTSTAASLHQPTPPRSRARTPGDFDFGDREDLDLASGGLSDDDILGDLAKPVSELRIESPAPRQSPLTSGGKAPARTVSPPPHVIGQIVEMGFTPQQARLALATTDSGVNVEQALESLLAAGGDVTSPTSFRDDQEETPQRTRSTARQRETQPRQQRDTAEPSSRTPGTSTPTTNGISGIQTDKLLAQASELGFNMFSNAKSFWNQGKEVVQKAYEENIKQSVTPVGGGNTRSSSRPSDGRPKWMTDAAGEGFSDELPESKRTTRQQFADDADGDVGSSSLDERSPQAARRPPQAAPPPAQPPAKKLLFDDDETAYVSPHRRRGAPSQPASQVASPAVASRQAARQAPATRVAPSRPKITVPETSPAAIASTISSRSKGTELFKLGQYAEAESAYTSAITSLPSNHILLTSLYTNRAAARLKTGDMGGAVSDCSNVFKLAGLPEDLNGILDLDEGQIYRFDGVPGKLDLREQVVKALQRRAQGQEGMERWEKARKDWERLAGLGWSAAQGRVKEEAVRSAGRCRGIVNSAGAASTTASTSSTPKPKSRPAPRLSIPVKDSEAAKRLRQAEAAKEQEADEQIQLKDSVDARIVTWKGGKETNVRALIASLETVLWPELGWQKVGMHELVTSNQVKIRYTKAIAKVHPDKLKPGNSTVEQRMLANGVFAGLNEAWGAFKQ